ncbi:DUF2065 domain-containing protein [Aliikangiella maris]|uniref:DUF2065 family protein n=2 Tax=Aliikangiella maris TaxID=3162458 RepID=A0ABV3MQ59_9GAMM
MVNELWIALAIALILEGMIPFLTPQGWRDIVTKIASLSNKNIRIMGLVVMMTGLLLLTVLR